MPYNDIEKKKRHNRQYRKDNKEKIQNLSVNYRKNNKKKIKESQYDYKRTHKGWMTITYNQMVRRTNKRKMKPLSFTKEALWNWVISQKKLFNVLWDDWAESNYNTSLIPSINRLDDYKSYTFDNMELTTWEDNNKKGNKSLKTKSMCGINSKINGQKCSKPVIRLDMDGNIIDTFPSCAEASRHIGHGYSSIAKCCNKQQKTAYGYKWEYA